MGFWSKIFGLPSKEELDEEIRKKKAYYDWCKRNLEKEKEWLKRHQLEYKQSGNGKESYRKLINQKKEHIRMCQQDLARAKEWLEKAKKTKEEYYPRKR